MIEAYPDHLDCPGLSEPCHLLFDFDGDAVRAADDRILAKLAIQEELAGFEDFDGDLRFAGIAAVGDRRSHEGSVRVVSSSCGGPCFRCRERNGFRAV